MKNSFVVFLVFWFISTVATTLLVLRIRPELTFTYFFIAAGSSLVTALFAGVMLSSFLCVLAAIFVVGIVWSLNSKVAYLSSIALYFFTTLYYAVMILTGAVASGTLSSTS